MRFIPFLLLLGLSAQAQRFQLQGDVKALEEGAWVYLSYGLQGKRIVDSTRVKQGKFRFKGKLNYPVAASVCGSSDALYDGDDRFGFILEPAKFIIYSEKQLSSSTVKNSPLNDDERELIRRMINHSLSSQNGMPEYVAYLKSGEQDSLLLKKAQNRQNDLSLSSDEVCIEFAKEHPHSYTSVQVLAKIMAGYEEHTAIYQRAKSIFEGCDNRWKKAPVIVELLEKKVSRPKFSW